MRSSASTSNSSGTSSMAVVTFLWLWVMVGRHPSFFRVLPWSSSTVSMAQGQAVMPTTWTPIIFIRPFPRLWVALAMSL